MPPDRPSTTSARYGTSSGPTERRSADPRRGILRDALGIALASGAYAISFGAISTAAGLSLIQTCALSLLMFTGASQFALVGVVGLDAAPPAAFLALLAPRLRAREPLALAIAAAVVAIAVLPFVPAGVPLLIVAVLVALFGAFRR